MEHAPRFTPEFLADLSWEIQPNREEEWYLLQDFAASNGLGFKGTDIHAIRGGKVLRVPKDAINDASVEKYINNDRPFIVVPAISKDSSGYDRMIHFPSKEISTEKDASRFDANLYAYRSGLAKYVKDHWNSDWGETPIPVAVEVKPSPMSDGRYVTITDYRTGYTSLGRENPYVGFRELDTDQFKAGDIKHLLEILDQVHVPTKKYLEWAEKTGVNAPKVSWQNPENKKCALRGQEWWYNQIYDADRQWNDIKDPRDRLEELTMWMFEKNGYQFKREDGKGKTVYQEFFSDVAGTPMKDEDIKKLLTDFIKTNYSIFPLQNGKLYDEEMAVVTHGTMFPDNIHKKIGANSPEYMITGGDRSQLVGYRAQMVDGLIAGSASHQEYMETFIKEFLAMQDRPGRNLEKERRALAMHVLYRSVSFINWHAERGNTQAVENLIKLTHDILTGTGEFWQGVDKPMVS